jgi:hypothetical protein
MIITYQGAESFKVQFGDTVLAFNPISKESKLKASRFGADIVLVSLNDKDMNGADQMSFGEKQPFIVSGPGEYEVKDIFIKGFKSSSDYGGKGRLNTIYSLTFEGMNLCFLGALNGEIDSETSEALGDIDILFTPIGGEGVLDAVAANKLAVKLEPRLIIPMHYGDVGEANALKKFLKEGSSENTKSEDKLTIKKKDLDGKEGDIVVLSPQA